jgi:hypothetical protein
LKKQKIMLIKLFVVPVGDNGTILGEMTLFLKAHKVLEIESHFISKPNGESWHFCVRYIESATNLPFGDSKTKIDYRETLDEATFIKFSKLREIRKKVAADAGVSIGNLTSQYFANHYLAAADHFAKEHLKIPAYVRYMDDMILWHDDKAALLEAGHQFRKYTVGVLHLELKPFCLNRNSKGLPFLGYRLFPDTVRLADRSKRRFAQKFKEYESKLVAGLWSQKEFQNHVTPLIAFTEYADAKGFRQGVLSQSKE